MPGAETIHSDYNTDHEDCQREANGNVAAYRTCMIGKGYQLDK